MALNSRTIVISSIRILIVVVVLTLIGFGVEKYAAYVQTQNRMRRAEKKELIDKVERYKQRERELQNIELTMKERYSFLSSYEIHYYSVLFQDYSDQYDVPWEVLAALIRVESNFDPSLRSPAGAKGMAQVMEYTGKDMADKLGIRYEEGKTLWNDLLNMVIGFTYFCEAYKDKRNESGTEDESVRHAIGTYIGGPSYNNKKQSGHRIYVKEYRVTVYQEYKTLRWMFKGVCASRTDSIDAR